jgi:hypothetical protein
LQGCARRSRRAGKRQRRALRLAHGTFPGPRYYWRATTPDRRHHLGAGMGLLISILVTFLVIILVLYLINMLPIDGRAKQIARIIVIIIGALSLLKYLAIY